MAQPASEFDTYDMIGIREDLSDMIWDISPTDTPFVSGCRKTTAKQTLHEWQTDALAAVDTGNAHIEGDDSTPQALTATTREKNSTQILKKIVLVSGTAQEVNTAGREDEMDYQIAKKMKEIKRDLEAITTRNQGRTAGSSAAARTLRSLESWIVTNDDRGAGGADGTDTTAATDGTQRAFTETILKNVIQQVWTSGGDPDVVMVGPKNKQAFSAFTGGATKFDQTEDKKLVAAIDLYVSDFGSLRVVPNRFQRDRTAFVLQKDMWSIATLRSLRKEPLAKTGDHDKAHLVWEVTLEANNEKASGVAADLTTP